MAVYYTIEEQQSSFCLDFGAESEPGTFYMVKMSCPIITKYLQQVVSVTMNRL